MTTLGTTYAVYGRYLVAGLGGLLVNITATHLFSAAVHLPDVAAGTVGFVCGLCVSFAAQKFFTFKDYARERTHHKFAQFAVVSTCNVAVNALLLVVLGYWGLPLLLRQALASLIIAGYSFFLWQAIFRASSLSAPAPQD